MELILQKKSKMSILTLLDQSVESYRALTSVGEKEEDQLYKLYHKGLKCKPWNHKRFCERLATFKFCWWFAKPIELSPLVCSRLGWKNTEMDLLACDVCNVHLLVKDPLDPNSVRKYLTSLLMHSQNCPWRGNPSPISFVRPQFLGLKEFQNCISNFFSLSPKSLPVLTNKVKTMFSVHKEKMSEYSRNLLPKFLQNCLQNDWTNPRHITVVLILILCGWRRNRLDTMSCCICQREVVLNYYKTEEDEVVGEVDEDEVEVEVEGKEDEFVENVTQDGHRFLNQDSHSSPSTVGRKTDTDNSEGANGKKRIDKISESPRKICKRSKKKKRLDPIAEHRWYCPWYHNTQQTLNTVMGNNPICDISSKPRGEVPQGLENFDRALKYVKQSLSPSFYHQAHHPADLEEKWLLDIMDGLIPEKSKI
eukprot:TRINITY_DN10961_c0_g1_i1.p1 TRINITY_DN10961_c0_g1~~TRINITY_DN10961_c0_g1_i1.p1  ORF type:complete len:421 (-),score=70.37 TRINITY_DN10961_c0_g1_i1:257-1519(-)